MKKSILFMLVLGLMSIPISGCGNSVSEKESKVEEQSTNKVLSSEEIMKYDEYLQSSNAAEVSFKFKNGNTEDEMVEKYILKDENSIDVYLKSFMNSSENETLVEITLKDGIYFLHILENKYKFKLQDETIKRVLNNKAKSENSTVNFSAEQLTNCSKVILQEENADTITLEIQDYDYENKFINRILSMGGNNSLSAQVDSPAILVIDKENKRLKSISIDKALKKGLGEDQEYSSFELKVIKTGNEVSSIEAPEDANSYSELPEDLVKKIESRLFLTT